MLVYVVWRKQEILVCSKCFHWTPVPGPVPEQGRRVICGICIVCAYLLFMYHYKASKSTAVKAPIDPLSPTRNRLPISQSQQSPTRSGRRISARQADQDRPEARPNLVWRRKKGKQNAPIQRSPVCCCTSWQERVVVDHFPHGPCWE